MKTYYVIDAEGDVSYAEEGSSESFDNESDALSRAEDIAQLNPGAVVTVAEAIILVGCSVQPPTATRV
ncbi:MAG: hypothetical protein AAGF48_13025 [Pseudomonadota bacterium]